MLFREFLVRGYQAVPVNPDANEIDGQPCFARLEEIQPPVDEVLFRMAPAVTELLVRDCAGAGIRRVWRFRGADQGAASRDAIDFCESHGIGVIPGGVPFLVAQRGSAASTQLSAVGIQLQPQFPEPPQMFAIAATGRLTADSRPLIAKPQNLRVPRRF